MTPPSASSTSRLSPAFLFALGAVVLFLWLAHEVQAGAAQPFDSSAVRYFGLHRTPLLRTLMQSVSLAGSGWVSLPLSMLSLYAVFARPRLRPDALRLLVALGGGQGLVTGLKFLYHRPRPSPAFAHLGYSFPSGHSFFAMTMYGFLADRLTRVALPRRAWVRPVAALLILGIGFSRVALGVHYPTDVLAGFAAGFAWLRLCLALPTARRTIPQTETTP